MKAIARLLSALMISLCMAACGGGGGSGSGGTNGGGGSSSAPTLVAAQSSVTFTSRAPGIDAPTQQISASVSNASSLSGTLYILVTASGAAVQNVSGFAITGTSGTAVVTPASSTALGSGTHQATISIRACMDSPNCASGELRGSPRMITVTYTVGTFTPRHRIVASSTGVALASLPSRATLTRTRRITDTLGHQSAWSATADQPWLAVTPAGVTGADLTLTANPAGLALDTTHYANVTVTSAEAGVPETEIIRVGLFVSAQAPEARKVVTAEVARLAVDPIRPYVYAHDDGTSLYVYNIYTGALETTLPLGKKAGSMMVSPDGSRLYVGDGDVASASGITPVDLATRTVGIPYGAPPSAPAALTGHVELVRIDGAELLLTANGYVYQLATRSLLGRFGDEFYRYNDQLAASRDGHTVCTTNRGLSPNTVRCYSLDFTDEGDDVAILRLIDQGSTGSNGQDIVVNAAGERTFVACGAPYVFASASVAAIRFQNYLPGTAYPNNVELAPDGRLFAGASVYYGGTDTWIYGANEVEVGQMRVAGTDRQLVPSQLRVSADGMRIVALDESLPGYPPNLILLDVP